MDTVISRRKALRALGAGSVVAAGAAAVFTATGGVAHASVETSRDAGDYMENMGVGMYSSPTTAMQLSTFTCTPNLVSCGVGTFAGGGGAGGAAGMAGLDKALGGLAEIDPAGSGPFAMLMYSLRVDRYAVDHNAGTINVTGSMRSITRMGGQTVEDAEHPFDALAVDNRGERADSFDVAFVTPFWTPGKNPLSMESPRHQGWAHFGGTVPLDLSGKQLGGVTVSR